MKKNGKFEFIWSQFRRPNTGREYLPAIDGLRFVAIATVVIYHIYMATVLTATTFPAEWLQNIFNNGSRGVPLFFAISGFVLALPFAKSLLPNGKAVPLKAYFLRRVIRIEPPYIIALTGFYLVALILGNEDASNPLFFESYLWRFFYLGNLAIGKFPLNSVTWSLEIEVQFYLLAPLLFLVFRAGKGTTYSVFILLILASLLMPRGDFFFLSLLGQYQYFLVGLIYAFHYANRDSDQHRHQTINDLVATTGLLILLVYPRGLNALPVIASIAMLLHGALYGNLAKRALSFAWVPVIGGMCYSIYLVHSPLLIVKNMVMTKGDSFFIAFFLLLLLAIPIIAVVSSLFYIIVERPFMATRFNSKSKEDKLPSKTTA